MFQREIWRNAKKGEKIMVISIDDTITTIDLQKIYDYLDVLRRELEGAKEVCKKIDDWSYWLPHNINNIKDELYNNTKNIDNFMADILTVITARKNIYDGYCEYLAFKQEKLKYKNV